MSRHCLRAIATAALIFICATGIVMVSLRAWFESRGGFHGDAAIYMTVARGLTQGITPYSGLFENKAPGVFLLGAFSAITTGGTTLLSWFQAIVISLMPLPLFLAGLRLRRDPIGRLLILLCGIGITLYVAEQAGQLLPESWGAIFALGFLALFAIAVRRPTVGKGTYVSLGVLLLLATGIKEPFFLSVIGGALVLLPSWRAGRMLLWPILGAGVAGIAGLLLLGQLRAYVTVHLAHMFGFHVFHPWGTTDEPLWLRLIDVPRILENMAGFSHSFAIAMAMLWIATLIIIIKSPQTGPHRGKGVLGLFCLGSFFNTAAVGFTGDFYSHHFVFAVPLFAACALRLASAKESLGSPLIRRTGAAFSALLLTITILRSPTNYSGKLAEWKAWAAPRIAAGEALDTVMTRCGMQRYLNLIDRPDGVYGFVQHVPYGPIFTQYGRFIGAMPQYLDALFDAMQTAPIALITTEAEMIPMSEETRSYIRDSFMEMPPACAGTFLQPVPYRILFRGEERE